MPPCPLRGASASRRKRVLLPGRRNGALERLLPRPLEAGRGGASGSRAAAVGLAGERRGVGEGCGVVGVRGSLSTPKPGCDGPGLAMGSGLPGSASPMSWGFRWRRAGVGGPVLGSGPPGRPLFLPGAPGDWGEGSKYLAAGCGGPGAATRFRGAAAAPVLGRLRVPVAGVRPLVPRLTSMKLLCVAAVVACLLAPPAQANKVRGGVRSTCSGPGRGHQPSPRSPAPPPRGCPPGPAGGWGWEGDLNNCSSGDRGVA